MICYVCGRKFYLPRWVWVEVYICDECDGGGAQ